MSVDSFANFAAGRLCSAYRSIRFGSGVRAGLPVVLAAGLTVSCSQGVPLRSSEQTRMVPTEQAFAVPEPGGPAVTAIIETSYSNATQQDILLATSASTPGQNMLRIQIFGPLDPKQAGPEKARAGYLPAKNINAEMRALFPGVRMQTSPYFVQNKYGPFGYAVGRSASGDTCFFGWQRIASTGFTQTLIGNKGSIQVRLRICDENASEDRLLQSMYGFTITASFRDKNWNPYGEPLPPAESLGRPGAPMYPVTTAPQPVSGPIGVAAPARKAGRTTSAAPKTTAPPKLPAPIGPLVPPPPGTETSSSPPPASSQAVPAPDAAVPLVPPPPAP